MRSHGAHAYETSTNELAGRMSAGKVTQIVEEAPQSQIATRQCARSEMNGLHVHQIVEHDTCLEIGHPLEISVDLFRSSHVLARTHHDVYRRSRRPDEAERSHEPEPAPAQIRALVVHARSH